MKAVAEFVVQMFELMEVEGSALRSALRTEGQRFQSATTSMAVGAAFLFASIPLCIAGLALLALALFWWLETQVSEPLAACLTGLATLAVGSACASTFVWLTRRPRR